MRRIVVLIFSLVLIATVRAAGPDDQYVDIYNEMLQGDSLQQSGQPEEAIAKYVEAQTALKALQQASPSWNPEVVTYRLDYLAEQIAALQKASAAPTHAVPPAHPAPVVKPPVERVLTETDILREQVRSLSAANVELQNKLKEALSIQPAAISPAELAKAEQKNIALQKERDLLAVALQQAKAAKSSAAPPGEPAKPSRQKADNDRIAADLVQLHAQVADLERQRDELKAKLAAALNIAPATNDGQVDQLRARLAVLEAKAVPFTSEELGLLSKSPPSASTPLPAQAPERKHIVHSMKDLPPGAGGLMEEATRCAMERDYAGAAEKYQQILRQDPNNVYVLAYLANTQFAMGQEAEGEKTVNRSLALDPEDAASLYLKGVLRYRHDKLDEAFDALSLSAKYSPTNAGTQNYLGCVLEKKGLRGAAETAFRKALDADPRYADAHYNLAFVYLHETPPSLQLARWHYQQALDLGHAKDQDMEKALAQSP